MFSQVVLCKLVSALLIYNDLIRSRNADEPGAKASLWWCMQASVEFHHHHSSAERTTSIHCNLAHFSECRRSWFHEARHWLMPATTSCLIPNGLFLTNVCRSSTFRRVWSSSSRPVTRKWFSQVSSWTMSEIAWYMAFSSSRRTDPGRKLRSCKEFSSSKSHNAGYSPVSSKGFKSLSVGSKGPYSKSSQWI